MFMYGSHLHPKKFQISVTPKLPIKFSFRFQVALFTQLFSLPIENDQLNLRLFRVLRNPILPDKVWKKVQRFPDIQKFNKIAFDSQLEEITRYYILVSHPYYSNHIAKIAIKDENSQDLSEFHYEFNSKMNQLIRKILKIMTTNL